MFNRDCFGLHSLQFAVRTRSWYRRLFLGVFGMCETNAMNAYREVVGPIERYEWLCKLSDALINNPWVTGADAGVEAAGEAQGSCANLHYLNHTVKCSDCGRLTHWICGCNVALCHPGTSDKVQRGPCYYNHVREGLERARAAGQGA